MAFDPNHYLTVVGHTVVRERSAHAPPSSSAAADGGAGDLLANGDMPLLGARLGAGLAKESLRLSS